MSLILEASGIAQVILRRAKLYSTMSTNDFYDEGYESTIGLPLVGCLKILSTRPGSMNAEGEKANQKHLGP